MTLDDLRTKHPDLGFALYAFEPGGPVTLEVITPDGAVFSFSGPSATGALLLAFPPALPPPKQEPTPPAPNTPTSNVFD